MAGYAFGFNPPGLRTCEQLGHDGLAVETFALPERFETLGDLRMNLVLAEPAPLRQVPFDGLCDQFTRRTMFFLGRRLYFGKQAGRNEGIARGIGFHVVQDSRPALVIKRINDFNTADKNRVIEVGLRQAVIQYSEGGNDRRAGEGSVGHVRPVPS
jgi:hypothetical protein